MSYRNTPISACAAPCRASTWSPASAAPPAAACFSMSAYLSAQLLRRHGLRAGGRRPVLPAPAARPVRAPLALANTYAALTELQHFSGGEPVSSARYLASNGGGAVSRSHEAGPPFTLLPGQPSRGSEHVELPCIRRAGVGPGRRISASRDLATPLGREMDESRRPVAASPPYLISIRSACDRLVWPRRQLLERAAANAPPPHRIAGCTRMPPPRRPRFANGPRSSGMPRVLASRELIAPHQETRARILKQPPERLFAQILEPLACEMAARRRGKDPQGRCLKWVPPSRPRSARETSGRTRGIPWQGGQHRAGRIEKALADAAAPSPILRQEAGRTGGARLIEDPRFRLAGAEEACASSARSPSKALQAQSSSPTNCTSGSVILLQRTQKSWSPCPANASTAAVWKGSFSRRTPGEGLTLAAELLEVDRHIPRPAIRPWSCTTSPPLHQPAGALGSTPRGRLLPATAGRAGQPGRGQTDAGPGPRRRSSGAEKRRLPPGCVDLDDALQQLEQIGSPRTIWSSSIRKSRS